MKPGKYHQYRTSAFRKLSMTGFDLVNNGHNFYALLEFDITNLRSKLRKERQNGNGGSLFAYLLQSIGKCLHQYPQFNSIINYKKTTEFFEVDVNIPIEIEHNGEIFTKQLIIRDINNKTLSEINALIENAKIYKDNEKSFVFSKPLLKILTTIPKSLTILLYKILLKNHIKTKELSGTVFVTSVSMFSNVPGFIIPYIGGPKACSFAIGSSNKKPIVINNKIEIREMINITAIFNHDIVDGAPAARFINELRSLIEK